MREFPHIDGFFIGADGRAYTDYMCTTLRPDVDTTRAWDRYLAGRESSTIKNSAIDSETLTAELELAADVTSSIMTREATRAHTVLTSLVTEIRTSSPNVLHPMEVAEGVDLLRHFLTPSRSELALADDAYVNTRQNIALTLISLTYDMSVSEKSKLAVRLLGIGAGIGRRT